MSAVSTIKPHLRDLRAPQLIRALPAWLVWRYEDGGNGLKPRKVPYWSDGGRRHGAQGRPEDRQRLTTFDAAKAAAMRRGFDGIGFALMPEWGIVALDFDNCVTPLGLHPDVERLVAGTYAEFSPSGNGVRAFVRGSLGNEKDAHGDPFGFETFSSKGFVTYTNQVLPICDLTDSADVIAEVSPELLAFCTDRFGRSRSQEPTEFTSDTAPLGLTQRQLKDALDVLDPSTGHDQWLRIGMALHHETQGEGFHLWDEWSAEGSQYPGTEVLQARWDSFGRGTQQPTTARALVQLANDNGAHIDTAMLEAADDFEVIEGPDPEPKANRFEVLPLDVFASRPPPTWVIKGVLPKAELVVLFGASGSGKSFIALDLAGAIAQGTPWRGHKVKQGRTVYIAAEGAGGFRNRVAAYCQHNQIEPASLNIGVIHAAPNMLLRDDALDVARAIEAAGGADVVIVDTFAQVMPGANENAGEDVGKALAHCKGIHRATGAVVVLVHHSGKDASKGARGWSGLRAAADAELEVVRTPGGRMLSTSKQKDGEDGLGWGFDLNVVQVGIDDDGDAITSCVVVEAAMPLVQQLDEAMKGRGPVETALMAVIQEIARSQTSGIEVEPVIAQAADMLPAPPDGKRDTRKQRIRRALKAFSEGVEARFEVADGCISIL